MREKRAIIVDTIVRRYISNLAKSMTENSAKTVTKFTGILYEINNTIKSNSSILCFIIANTIIS
jgi:hypothetical protein